MTLNESFIIDAKGRKVSVVLPIKNYEKMVEDLEELEDIKAYDKVMQRKHQFIPLEKALSQIEATRKKKG